MIIFSFIIAPLPIKDISGVDTIDREVEFTPEKNVTYDARYLACGMNAGDVWQSGFFDKGSFVET